MESETSEQGLFTCDVTNRYLRYGRYTDGYTKWVCPKGLAEQQK